NATDELFPLLYDELRRMARGMMSHERPGHTLQATALVHEVYVRLLGSRAQSREVTWQSRGHFFSAAARAMRCILIDRARHVRATASIRTDGRSLDHLTPELTIHAIDTDTATASSSTSTSDELLALDAAMQSLAQRDPRQHDVVMLRFFAGLTVEQTAEVLGRSAATVKNDWAFARAWLTAEMRRTRTTPPAGGTS
ncbi:MAG: ECF-type sigma factor, partial [Phycisphaerales bacterium]|nr:ECF-type sigma factor [Phycisphaerales bacterium]